MIKENDIMGADFEDNLGDTVATPEKKIPKKAEIAPVRVRIVLEENDQIGPSGQFFGADGRGYMLRPGEEADVPESILNILDTAVMSVPVKDGSDTVTGYRDRLRFPYRFVRPTKA